MKVECPDCKHRFQAIDVDGVMSERRLIHEVLEEAREVERLRADNHGLVAENLHLEKRWKADNFYFCAMMQLLKEASIAPGSTKLIAAGRRYEESESQRIAAGTADEKPDGQSEN